MGEHILEKEKENKVFLIFLLNYLGKKQIREIIVPVKEEDNNTVSKVESEDVYPKKSSKFGLVNGLFLPEMSSPKDQSTTNFLQEDSNTEKSNQLSSSSFNFFDRQSVSKSKAQRRNSSFPSSDKMSVIEENEMESLVQNLVGLIPEDAAYKYFNEFLNKKKKEKKEKKTYVFDVNCDYEVACPYAIAGCNESFNKSNLEKHVENCSYSGKDSIKDFSHLTEPYNPLNHIVACPFRIIGCEVSCKRSKLPDHIESCPFKVVDKIEKVEVEEYDVVCPNTIMGCEYVCLRRNVEEHLKKCRYNPESRETEQLERILNRKIAVKAAETERKRRVRMRKYRYNSSSKDEVKDNKSLFSEALRAIDATKKLHTNFARTQRAVDRVAWVVKAAEIEILRRKVINIAKKRMSFHEKYAPKNNEQTRRFKRSTSVSSTQSVPFKSVLKEVDVHFYETTDDIGIKSLDKAMSKMTFDLNLEKELNQMADEFSKQLIESKLKVLQVKNILCDICKECFNDFIVSLDLYGSYATDLALPDVSDIDLVLSITTKLSSNKNFQQFKTELQMNQSRIMNGFRCEILGRRLKSQNYISNIKVLSKATVPIIKFKYEEEDSKQRFEVDISFAEDSHRGRKVVDFINTMKPYFPHLYPVISILKLSLFKHGLDDPFTGGLSSYSLLLMVFASLGRSYQTRDIPCTEIELLDLLVDFLKLFTTEFDFYSQSVVYEWLEHPYKNIMKCVVYVGKRPTNPVVLDDVVVILDPFDVNNNVARSTFRFSQIQSVFRNLLSNLIAAKANICFIKYPGCRVEKFKDSKCVKSPIFMLL